MLQNTSTTEYKHKLFVERVAEFGVAWALESDDSFATSGSNDFEDAKVIPFWSDEAYANALSKEEWEDYTAAPIPLAEFLENWLIGMYNDGLIVGTNWDANMFGKEIEPLELALELANELTIKGKTVALNKYKDMADFQTQVKQALEG